MNYECSELVADAAQTPCGH